MALVPLVTPASEPELFTTRALLEAYGVPHHVRGGGFGSLYPGLQGLKYTAATILVPEEHLEDALGLLAAKVIDPPSE